MTTGIIIRHEFNEVIATTEKCFLLDFTAPDHCINKPPCSSDPLDIGERIQDHSNIRAVYVGYVDPNPNSPWMVEPSGINQYKIDVYNVQFDYLNEEIYADILGGPQYESVTSSSVHEHQFNLPEKTIPMLYAIYLTVLDSSGPDGNFRFARRFVAYDKTSTNELDTTQSHLRTITANPSTDFKWQVTLNSLVVDWKNYFYNSHLRDTNFLWKIRPESYVNTAFDQTTGLLPVSGTDNVDGIVEFQYSFTKVSPTSADTEGFKVVSPVTSQRITLAELSIEDGDQVDIFIKATDYRRQERTEHIHVDVDSSPPLLQNIWLTKDGYKQLFVHNSTDLAKMELKFEALDIHSGIKQVVWRLGTSPKGSDIGQESLPVVKMVTQFNYIYFS